MFTGRPWFLTPGTSSPTAAVEKLSAFVTALGSTPRIMDPAVHDRLMAWLSHLPQVMASTLMHLVGEAVGDDGLSLSGRGLRDTTRLASSAATPWADVCATNADAVGEALDALIGTLTELRHDLEDGQRLTRVFESAQHWRRHLE
jgi:prephenate dehydrogenase